MNQRWLLLSAVDSESSLETLPLLMIQPSYWRRRGWILSLCIAGVHLIFSPKHLLQQDPFNVGFFFCPVSWF
jgi:hypothetical protein